jgi:PilZ domain
MTIRSGRLEKRARLTVPLQISSLQDPSAGERTTTENVSSSGVRVLTYRSRNANERLLIKGVKGDLQILARVVYCQRLSDGRFGVGVQFQEAAGKWPNALLAGGPTK